MKNPFKILGNLNIRKVKVSLLIIAIVAIIGFSMAACTDPDPDPEDTTTPWLTVDSGWTDEQTLADSGSYDWYRFAVDSGTTYYVWVKEYWSNSVVVADGYADVRLDAKYTSKTGTAIFTNSDAGANSTTTSTYGDSSSFTADQTGTVYIKVSVDQTLLSGGAGKYKVAITSANARPAGEGSVDRTTPVLPTTGAWTDEKTLDTLQSFDWYQFTVTSGTTYYVFVKENLSSSVGPADDYADVRLEARYSNKDTGDVIFTNSDAGANSSTTPSTGAPSSFTASQSGIVYLKVSVDQTIFGKAGKYKVAVTTTNSRPSGEGASLTVLTSGTWSVERAISSTVTETWHTFYASNGTTYYIYVKDDDSILAPATGYADVMLDAKYSSKTGTAIFTASDAGSNSGDLSFTATQSATVYIRVFANTSTTPRKYGNYRIAYSTSSTRPSGE